jgi:hypothetical protein
MLTILGFKGSRFQGAKVIKTRLKPQGARLKVKKKDKKQKIKTGKQVYRYF